MELKDLVEEYESNMGGAACIVYVGLHQDVETWPTLPADTGDIEEIRKLTGNVIMKAGKRMFEVRSTEDTTSLIDEDQGEIDGMSQRNLLQFFHPQTVAKLLGFVQRSNNRKFFFIVENKEGQFRMVGSQRIAAQKVAQNTTTGATAADRKGATLSFFSYSHGPAPIYTGTIPLTDASSGSGN